MGWSELGGAPAATAALAVLSGCLLFLLLAARSRISPRGGTPACGGDCADLRSTVSALQEELRELSDAMTHRLDAKIGSLRELLQQATKTIQELRRLSPGAASGRPVTAVVQDYTNVRRDQGGTPPPGDTPAGRRAPRRAAAPPQSIAAKHAQVCELAAQGMDTTRVASLTGMQSGEIELILSLNRTTGPLDRGGRRRPARAVEPHEEAEA
jgi:hypothetical protein